MKEQGSGLKIILIIVLLALAFCGGFFVQKIAFTGQTITETNTNSITSQYSWTTAICNASNECIDIHVECDGGKILSLKPMSGLMHWDSNWSDPRGGNPNVFCKR